MEIIDTRHTTPDLFSIKDVRVAYDWSREGAKYVSPTLIVSLEPEGYMRDRFAQGGASYEKKKHGARQIKITGREMKRLIAVFNEEVDLCHQVLLDHGLIPELLKLRTKRQEAKVGGGE
jgi:hypothetical protein